MVYLYLLKKFNIIKIWIRNDNDKYKQLIGDILPFFKLEYLYIENMKLEY